ASPYPSSLLHIAFSTLPHPPRFSPLLSFFFFNDTATTEISTLSLHDALPICAIRPGVSLRRGTGPNCKYLPITGCSISMNVSRRSEEHTSELQSLTNLVCRLLLEKKKKKNKIKYKITKNTNTQCRRNISARPH